MSPATDLPVDDDAPDAADAVGSFPASETLEVPFRAEDAQPPVSAALLSAVPRRIGRPSLHEFS